MFAGIAEPSDVRLVCLTLDGDLKSFDVLMRRYQTALFAFLKHRTSNVVQAEDLVQETFLRAFTRLNLFDGRKYSSDKAFSIWLFTIARRLALNELRGLRRQTENVWSDRQEPADCESYSSQGNVIWEELPTREEAPEVALIEQEQKEGLWDWARRALTEEQWSALWLRYSQEYSAKQIALIMDKTPGSVKSLLARAKERLTVLAKQSNLTWNAFSGWDN